ncbi:MAG: hypothetical protein CVU57_04230 [Deltaproteobacteria bacterium HGW-Deltaproteobacteria-15]|jgi:hypothetical protein|nr:MAG: hypothetical protein CVU57_04230 [Deltaproteobacteria bacterium HGW-Deltaproteobacteria-15]
MEKDTLKYRVLSILNRHIGKEKAIDMGELYERVYEQTYKHKINDTRPLRTIITMLRKEGNLICSTRSKTGGGYYLPRSGHEFNQLADRILSEGIKKIQIVARMKQVGLAELLGQMALNLKGGGSEEPGAGEQHPC